MENARAASMNGLDEGLRVRHIATFPLATCKVGDDVAAILRPDYKDYDQSPVVGALAC